MSAWDCAWDGGSETSPDADCGSAPESKPSLDAPGMESLVSNQLGINGVSPRCPPKELEVPTSYLPGVCVGLRRKQLLREVLHSYSKLEEGC